MALQTDLHALKGESIAEGIHLGAMGGTLDVLQRRYLGITPCREGLWVDPAVPHQLGSVRLGFRYRKHELEATGSSRGVRVCSSADNSDVIELLYPGGHAQLKPGEAAFVEQRQN